MARSQEGREALEWLREAERSRQMQRLVERMQQRAGGRERAPRDAMPGRGGDRQPDERRR